MKSYTGRQIRYRASKGLALTETQTAEDALKSLREKYGTVVDQKQYYHTGRGVWVKKVRV